MFLLHLLHPNITIGHTPRRGSTVRAGTYPSRLTALSDPFPSTLEMEMFPTIPAAELLPSHILNAYYACILSYLPSFNIWVELSSQLPPSFVADFQLSSSSLEFRTSPFLACSSCLFLYLSSFRSPPFFFPFQCPPASESSLKSK